VVVVLGAAGVTTAILLPSPSHHDASVEQLVATDPQLVISTPTRPPTSVECDHLVRGRFLQANSGSSVVGGVVEFSGHMTFFSCGANGVRLVMQPTNSQFRLAPKAIVIRRSLGGSEQILPGELPLYLSDSRRTADASRTRFFRFTGPRLAVTKLVELTRP